MEKKKKWKLPAFILIAVVLILSVAACIFFIGGRSNTDETTVPTTTAPVITEPTTVETMPQETEPEPEIIQAGHMEKHDKGKNGDKGIYFTMKPNDVPKDTTWKTEWRPTTKSAIQLIRDGETYDIGKTAGGMVIKYSDTEYYLKLEEYLIRDYYPIRDNDIIKIEGIFRNGQTLFQIDTSYMLISEGLVFYTTEYPEGLGVSVKYVGNPTSHPSGMTSNGIYFTLEKNSVPFRKDWSLAYTPTSESSVRLIRDGKTYNIGNKAAETIVKYSDTEYYLKMEKWIIKDFYPIRDGDIIVLSGKFVNSGVSTVFSISETYISITEGMLFFSNEYPSGNSVEPVKIPTMLKHPNGLQGNGLFFSAAEKNSLPFDGWKIEYYPRAASCVKLIRNGETKDIGNVDAAAIVKFSETEYYVKLDEWIYKENHPFVDGDILVFEGKFVNSGLGALMEIGKTYVLISDGMAIISSEYPTGNTVEPVKIPTMLKHPNGLQGNGLYFSAAEKNSLPFDDWKIEYYPRAASCVKLIRNGETKDIGNVNAAAIVKFRETEYYLKLDEWIYKENHPFVDGDILVIEGRFVNSGMGALMEIGKTYVLISNGMAILSTEYPTGNTVEAVKIPYMQEHPNGLQGKGLYFSAEENSLPFDGWKIEYYPRAASCVKLIRNGETKDIGNVNAAAIVKFSETGYYLKLDDWIYKENHPFVDGDILVIEGQFVNSGMGALMEIGKTYVAFNSGMAYLSTEYPTGPVGPTKIMAGAMQSHENGWQAGTTAPWGGLFFKMAPNDAPYDGWSLRYVPTNAANIKLIRDGKTYDVANTGAEMIAKYGEKDYYLEFWPISEKPIKEGDILVVEGNFVNSANNVVLSIDKTYITLGAGGGAEFSSSTEEALQVGHMTSHPNGWNTGSNDGLYFTLAKNDVPYDKWNVEYEPVSAAGLKLVRGGETYNIGQPGKGTIVKYGDTDYYLKLAAWTIGDYYPIVPGDVLIVEGNFKNNTNGTIFAIDRSVITVGDGYALTFTKEENVDNTIQAGAMSSHPNGWNTQNNKGMYFTMASNEIPFSDDWKTFYTPTTPKNIQLIRGGETFDIAQTDREFIIKYGDTDYYLKLEKWTIGDYFPVVPGDVIVVGGAFTDAINGVDFTIDTTYITVGEGYVLTFSQDAPEIEPPDAPTPETDGPLTPHPEKGLQISGSENLIFAQMTSNSGVHSGWATEYTPTAAAGLKLVRGGATYDIGNPGQGTLVKYSDTEYCLKLAPWTATGNHLPLVAGDQIIVEGAYIGRAGTPCEGSTITIAKTVITYNTDGSLTFTSEAAEPEEPDVNEPDNHGMMAAHSVNGWTATGGLYFAMKANDVPYDKWSVRYTPTAQSNVKLIRGGQTYDVAHTQRETIVKFSETEYYYEFWTLDTYKPIVAGDVMIVEGDFVNTANGATLTIAKTIITFNADGKATFQGESAEPEEPDVNEPENAELVLKAWDEKAWNTGSNGGFWFTMDSNDIPADGTWALEYTPVSEDVLKLVRNGETVNIAIPGRGTLVKVSDAEYYLKLEWNIGDYANTITVGDQIIIEGDFTNATNGVTFTVKKTTVTIGENYVLTFASEETEEPENDIIAVGAMAAHSDGITSKIIYFSLAENSLPNGLTKSDFRPVSADVIKLIRGGQTYDIGNPDAKTVVKQTADKYRLLRSALTMELQAGDVLVVDGKFTGGNTGAAEVFTINVTKTYITIGDGTVSFSTVPPVGA